MKIRTYSFLKNFMTPDLQKSSKNLEILKKNFFSRNNQKSLNSRSISGSLQKSSRNLEIFKNIFS